VHPCALHPRYYTRLCRLSDLPARQKLQLMSLLPTPRALSKADTGRWTPQSERALTTRAPRMESIFYIIVYWRGVSVRYFMPLNEIFLPTIHVSVQFHSPCLFGLPDVCSVEKIPCNRTEKLIATMTLPIRLASSQLSCSTRSSSGIIPNLYCVSARDESWKTERREGDDGGLE